MNHSNKQDIEANYFARCLLMPKSLVIEEYNKYVKKLNTNNDVIYKLSEIFQVEFEAMRFRLQELKLMDYGIKSI